MPPSPLTHHIFTMACRFFTPEEPFAACAELGLSEPAIWRVADSNVFWASTCSSPNAGL